MTVTIDQLVIDPEFSAPAEEGGPLPRMYPFDRKRLLANIVADKEIREKLSYWHENGDGNPILVDGHNRYDIYEELKGTIDAPQCVEITGPTSRAEVRAWIQTNDAGRRGNIEKKMECAIREVAPAIQAEAAKRKADANRDRQKSQGNSIVTLENPATKHPKAIVTIRAQVDAMLGVPVPYHIVQRVLNEMKEESSGATKAEQKKAKQRAAAATEAEGIKAKFEEWLSLLCDGSCYSKNQIEAKVGKTQIMMRFLWMAEVSPNVRVLRVPGHDKGYTFTRVLSDCEKKLAAATECVERLHGKLQGLPESVVADIEEMVNLLCNQEELEDG